MDFLSLIIVLILVGAAVYVAGILPIDEVFKQIIKVIAVIGAVIYVLSFFLGGPVHSWHIR